MPLEKSHAPGKTKLVQCQISTSPALAIGVSRHDHYSFIFVALTRRMSCRQFGLLDPNVWRPYAELLVNQTSFTALMILRVRRPGASISNYLRNYVFVCFSYASMSLCLLLSAYCPQCGARGHTPGRRTMALTSAGNQQE